MKRAAHALLFFVSSERCQAGGEPGVLAAVHGAVDNEGRVLDEGVQQGGDEIPGFFDTVPTAAHGLGQHFEIHFVKD